MLRKIKLYGKLAKFVGHRILEADVATAAEAVRFLVTNWPELELHMAAQHYRVSVGDYDLTLDEIHDPAGQQDIRLIPVMAGAGALGRILLGVVLIAGAFLTGGATIGLFGLAAPVAISSALLYAGAGLVLGGVAQLLSPTPRLSTGPDTQNDPRKNFSFSGIQNTSRQGTPVPIVYGETLVGSVVISAGFDTTPPPGTADSVTTTLVSTQYAQIIDLLSEGEIEGFKDNLAPGKFIYFNKVPLVSAGNTVNINTDIQIRLGGPASTQTLIPFATEIAEEYGVSAVVRSNLAITRTITDTQVDAVRVTISVPRLEEITLAGASTGSSFGLQILIQSFGGSVVSKVNETIIGKSAELYQRDYLIDLSDPLLVFPINITVKRTTPDNTITRIANEFLWGSYTELIYQKLTYPNSALVGLKLDAEQFSSIPQRSYLIRGIKIAIPSNATVDAVTGRLTYTGAWNGTFDPVRRWTSDPAWILWDLLTSTRYGCGEHIKAEQLDKFAFFSASQYCSELVPNGFGGTEPRYSCNVNIQTQEDVYKLINNMCSTFRAMPYWAVGALSVSQDKPANPSCLFTLANVTEEGFNYSSSSLKVRPNVAIVSYLDTRLQDVVFEVVEDAVAIQKYGVIKTEVEAFGCTSPGQARRLGEWTLYAEQQTPEIINFTTSTDCGVVVRPGQVISVADPVKAGNRRGGRINAATTTTVTADNAADLPSSGGELSVILPDGTVEKRTVAARVGQVFTVTTAFSNAPNANAVWLYENSAIQLSTWRVLSIEENDGIQYTVGAIKYNSSSYDYIERDQPLSARDVTDLNLIPVAPSNLNAVELLYDDGGSAKAKITVSWQAVPGINFYRVKWRKNPDNWTVVTVQSTDYDIMDTSVGIYNVEVYSIGANLSTSTLAATLTKQAFGKTAPPSNVTNASLVATDATTGILRWDRAVELDVVLGGTVIIKHSKSTTSASWPTSNNLAVAAGGQTQTVVPLLEGSYSLKFQDDSGNYSANAFTFVFKKPAPQPLLVVQTLPQGS